MYIFAPKVANCPIFVKEKISEFLGRKFTPKYIFYVYSRPNIPLN